MMMMHELEMFCLELYHAQGSFLQFIFFLFLF